MCGGVLGPQLLVFLRGYRIKLICGYSELGSTFIKIVRVCDGAVNKIRGVFFLVSIRVKYTRHCYIYFDNIYINVTRDSMLNVT